VRPETPGLTALLDEHPDFLRGVDPLELGGRTPDPQQPDDAVALQLSSPVNGSVIQENRISGGRDPAARTLRIGDGPALGACSPNTTCRNEMRATATTDATPPRVRKLRNGGSEANQSRKQVRHGVFGHVAQEDRGDGDAELRRRQLAVEILQRRLHGLSLPVAAPRRASMRVRRARRARKLGATKNALARTSSTTAMRRRPIDCDRGPGIEAGT